MSLEPGLEKQEQTEEAEAEGNQTGRRFTRTVNPAGSAFAAPVLCPPLAPAYFHRRFQSILSLTVAVDG
jgi:hypothetical protein